MADIIYYSSLVTTATGTAVLLWFAWCLREDLPGWTKKGATDQ